MQKELAGDDSICHRDAAGGDDSTNLQQLRVHTSPCIVENWMGKPAEENSSWMGRRSQPNMKSISALPASRKVAQLRPCDLQVNQTTGRAFCAYEPRSSSVRQIFSELFIRVFQTAVQFSCAGSDVQTAGPATKQPGASSSFHLSTLLEVPRALDTRSYSRLEPPSNTTLQDA